MKFIVLLSIILMQVGCHRAADTKSTADKKAASDAGTAADANTPTTQGSPVPAANPTVAAVDQANPLVAHIVVALCDNKHQGIVPVPANLGNGQDPDGNLYWGARYGVRTFMTRNAGWAFVSKEEKPSDGILERIVLKRQLVRNGKRVNVILVADAWDGRAIRFAIGRFLQYACGQKPETVQLTSASSTFQAGGASHFVGYVGHNGLMEFSLKGLNLAMTETVPQASMVLACKSKPYFEKTLSKPTGRTTVLTTNSMAPEAYTLDAVLKAWAQRTGPGAIHAAAGNAYAKYQKCSMVAGRRMFAVETVR